MRTCQDCNLELNDNHFKKHTRKKCIDCYKEYYRVYRKLNKDRIKTRQQNYQKDNIEILREKRKEYRELNKDKIKENYINFIAKNTNYNTIYSRERYKKDNLFKLIRNYRNLVKLSFMNKKIIKSKNSEKILGCSFEDFKIYLENKFEDWMTWENRGLYNGELNYGWDIDHIIPISSAVSEEEIVNLSHYSNLQPLCSKINREIKRNNLIY